MKELDDYLDAVGKRKPRLVATGQVNVAALMVLQDDDVPRLARMLKMAVAQLETQLENCTSEGQAAGLEECFFDLRRLVLAGCTGRIGGHVANNWFRSRPVAKQAIQWTGKNLADVTAFCPSAMPMNEPGKLAIMSLQGVVQADQDDWIIKGQGGADYYPCKPDVFTATYEPA